MDTPTTTSPEPETLDPSDNAPNPKVLRLIKAYYGGTLSYNQWKQLNRVEQHAYAKQWGRPRSPEELVGRKRTTALRHRQRKVARASKQRNRR